jgi:hypothetical protein
VGSRRRRSRPLLGDWNDWAWLSVFCGVLSLAAAIGFDTRFKPLTILPAALTLLTGILGEGKSRRGDLDGRGKWLARIGIATGLATLVWCLAATV